MLPALPSSISLFEEEYEFTTLAPIPMFPNLVSGVLVQASVQGNGCESANFSASLPEGSAFVYTVSGTSPVFTHSFACETCMYDSLSLLKVEFSGNCHNLAILVSSVGAQAVVSAANYIVEPTSGYLSSADVTVIPSVEVVTNNITETFHRGFLFTAPNPPAVTLVQGTPPEKMTLTVYLPLSTFYSGITLRLRFEPPDLVYQVGAVGIGAETHTVLLRCYHNPHNVHRLRTYFPFSFPPASRIVRVWWIFYVCVH